MRWLSQHAIRTIALLTFAWFILGGAIAMAGSMASMDTFTPEAVAYRNGLMEIWLTPVAVGVLLLVAASVLRRRRRGHQREAAKLANRIAVPGPIVDGVQTYVWQQVEPEPDNFGKPWG